MEEGDKKYLYTIGEVADILGENVSLVRFWSNEFSRFIKPQRNAKGNRKYTAGDIEVLRQVQYLLKTRGMTIEGAAKQLQGEDKTLKDRVKAIDTLKQIRKELVEIRNTLK